MWQLTHRSLCPFRSRSIYSLSPLFIHPFIRIPLPLRLYGPVHEDNERCTVSLEMWLSPRLLSHHFSTSRAQVLQARCSLQLATTAPPLCTRSSSLNGPLRGQTPGTHCPSMTMITRVTMRSKSRARSHQCRSLQASLPNNTSKCSLGLRADK